jgi:cobalt-zinc-cadmium efflux system outer membrane protein
MGRWLACFVLCYSFISSTALAQPLEERAGVRQVCRAGVDSAVAKARKAQGDAAVVAAEVLPNPVLVVEHQRSLTGATDRETILGLSVPLGLGGRRWALQDAAQARRKQASLEAHAGLLDAALSFRESYVVAAFAQARAEVLSNNQAHLDALTAILQKLAKGGEAAGYDQLRQSASSRLHRQTLELTRAIASSARAQLQSWLEDEVTLPPGAAMTLAAHRTDLVDRPTEDTAEVQGLAAQARADELEARAARRRAVPELSIFGGYRAVTAGSETGHGLSLGLEVPITMFDHGQGEAARASSDAQLARAWAQRLRKRQKAAQHASQLAHRQLAARVSEAQATSRDALSVRDKATQLYAAGEASITELLEAHRFAEDVQLAELSLLEQLARSRLAQMRAAGSMFDTELDQSCRGGVR